MRVPTPVQQRHRAAQADAHPVFFTSVDLTPAAELTHLTLRHARAAGPVTLPASLSELQLHDSTVSALAPPADGAPPPLRRVNISRTALTGEVPARMLGSKHLESLALSHNAWSAMPASWHAPALRVLLLDDNDLGVRRRALLRENP